MKKMDTFLLNYIPFVVGDAQDIRQVKHLFGPRENVQADSRTAP